MFFPLFYTAIIRLLNRGVMIRELITTHKLFTSFFYDLFVGGSNIPPPPMAGRIRISTYSKINFRPMSYNILLLLIDFSKIFFYFFYFRITKSKKCSL